MAERHLVEKAAEFTPPALRALGERILEVICPERYDDHERASVAGRGTSGLRRHPAHPARARRRIRRPAREDPRSHRGTVADLPGSLHRTPPRRHPGTGGAGCRTDCRAECRSGCRTCRRHGWADPGAVQVDETDGRRVPADQRRGQAFCALLEAVDPDRLPLHGGTATTVVVTIPFEGLAAGAGVGTLGDGTRISASEARRLACGANILPAVLDGRLRSARPRPHPAAVLRRPAQGPRHPPTHLPRRRLHRAVDLV